jgi:hypothetical protein
VVYEDAEVARFEHLTETLYGLVDGQQLAIVYTVFLPSPVEFLGKEDEGLPGVFDTLL